MTPAPSPQSKCLTMWHSSLLSAAFLLCFWELFYLNGGPTPRYFFFNIMPANFSFPPQQGSPELFLYSGRPPVTRMSWNRARNKQPTTIRENAGHFSGWQQIKNTFFFFDVFNNAFDCRVFRIIWWICTYCTSKANTIGRCFPEDNLLRKRFLIAVAKLEQAVLVRSGNQFGFSSRTWILSKMLSGIIFSIQCRL